jgi:UDP-N-acetylglucosamine 2-epimerase (non-hydrolysing)/GDP/UDP-N,N'-diacetylbacillosamine 2-epimerase (hydrolysing)
MNRRKICVVTGTRAEYGLLSRLIKLIQNDNDLELQVIATNMHLSPLYGYTYKEIEADGINIDRKIDILKFDNTNLGIAQSTGLGVSEFAKAFKDLQPDLILILGDRYEMLAVVTAALFMKVPVAHLHGGEITEGAIDDSLRHSITKLSHLHFTSTEEYKNRVVQMGESPLSVFNVGAIGIDNIKHTTLLSRDEFEKSIGFKLDDLTFLVTYHPATLDCISSEVAMKNLLAALDNFPAAKIIFTKPNSDADSEIISEYIDNYVENNPKRCISFISLGYLRYLSSLKYVDVVIGNSSSGILEVPSFKIPTVNIGNRQKGRIAASSVLNCGTSTEEIVGSIKKALLIRENEPTLGTLNPYEKEDTADLILQRLKKVDLQNLLVKKFYDIC